jgi:hypothetical protein
MLAQLPWGWLWEMPHFVEINHRFHSGRGHKQLCCDRASRCCVGLRDKNESRDLEDHY